VPVLASVACRHVNFRRRLAFDLQLADLRRPQRFNMAKNLFVGNLPYTTTTDDLRAAFERFGAVTRAQVVSDRETGRSRGFGFVEMEDGADAAIEEMNGKEFNGRTLTVNEARPREGGRDRRR
jgi:cold-inducible RNA-binding protein